MTSPSLDVLSVVDRLTVVDHYVSEFGAFSIFAVGLALIGVGQVRRMNYQTTVNAPYPKRGFVGKPPVYAWQQIVAGCIVMVIGLVALETRISEAASHRTDMRDGENCTLIVDSIVDGTLSRLGTRSLGTVRSVCGEARVDGAIDRAPHGFDIRGSNAAER